VRALRSRLSPAARRCAVIAGIPAAVLVVGLASSASNARTKCGWLRPARSAVRGAAVGDVDGDRRPDRVSVVARYGASTGCRFALRVALGTGRVLVHPLADPLVGGDPRDLRALPWPRLLAVVKIAPRGGGQPVVAVDQGAASVSVAVFAVRGLRLLRLQGAEFSSAEDGTTAGAVDCWHGAGSGTVVSAFAVATRRDWSVSRRRYRLVGDRFRLLRPSLPPFRVNRLPTLPEFRGGELAVFPSCTISRPR
jgi:hypothetical protein